MTLQKVERTIAFKTKIGVAVPSDASGHAVYALDVQDAARAAIEELMDPTDAIQLAGAQSLPGRKLAPSEALAVYRAMLQAVLA